MKREFTVGFILLVAASLAMWLSQRPKMDDGKTPLVWTSDDNPLRQEQIALFNKLHPRLDLQLDPNNQGIEKVIVQSMSGVGPDLIDCRDANQLAAYVKAGIAWDVTGQLASAGIDVQRDTWTCMQPMAIYSGRVYGVPTNCAANAIWINKKLFADANIPLPKSPWTWVQFIKLAEKLTKRGPDGRPIQFGFLMDWWNFAHFRATFGGTLFSEDGANCTLDSPGNIAALQLMHDLVYKYKVTPSPVEESGMASAGGWGSGTINLFGSGRGAMALGGRWWLANLRDFKGLDLTVIESPYGSQRACSSAGRATLINARSPRREEALQFLKFLASKPYGDLVNSQADGIAAFKSQSRGESFLHDPAHPNENYNAIWRAVTKLAVGSESSPFINGEVVQQILDKQVDLVRIDAKTAAQAMADATRQIDEVIIKNVRQDPSLRLRWTKATGQSL